MELRAGNTFVLQQAHRPALRLPHTYFYNGGTGDYGWEQLWGGHSSSLVAMRWVKVSHTHLEAMLPLSPCHTSDVLAGNGECTGT